jgi:hypothetical protein
MNTKSHEAGQEVIARELGEEAGRKAVDALERNGFRIFRYRVVKSRPLTIEEDDLVQAALRDGSELLYAIDPLKTGGQESA